MAAPAAVLARRARGKRRIPSRRHRAPTDPYGPAHQAIRKYLMAQLAATGPWPCPLCQQPMHAGMGRTLHLHHSNPGDKLRGLPGDTLAHGRCNLSDGGRLGAAITNSAVTATTGRRSRRW